MGRRLGILIAAGVLAAVLGFVFARRPVDPVGPPHPYARRATVRSEGARVEAREGATSRAASPEEAPRWRLGEWGGLGGLFATQRECWLSGFVTDEDGQPLPGAEVVVRDSAGRFAQVFEQTRADEEGHYRLGPFVPGLYVVSADAEGFVELERKGHPLAAEEERLDLALRRALPVEGTVVDEAGQPVGGVSLFLVGPAEDPEDEDGQQVFAFTDSREDGTFLLDAPRPGDYRLRWSHTDFLEAERTVTAPARGLRLVVPSGATVHVEVVDEAGRPVPHAEVHVRPEAPERAFRERLGFTDEAGTVTLQGIAPGRQAVVAAMPDEVPPRTARHALEVRGSERVRVRLQFDEGLGLSGVVVDAEGRPVEGAEARAVPAALVDPSGGEDPALDTYWERVEAGWFEGPSSPGRTGPDGRFTLRHLRPGEHLVTALKEGHVFDAEATGGRARTLGPSTGVLVPAGASDVRLVLRALAHVRGRVVRADGSPVPRFQLNGLLQEDARGAFRWPIQQEGAVALAFAAPGLSSTVREVRVRRGVDVDLGDVVLGVGREVRVRVVDARTAEPLVGASVELRAPGEEGLDSESSLRWSVSEVRQEPDGSETTVAPESSQTRHDGTRVLPNVEERPWLLWVSHPDYLKASVPLGETQREVTVALRSGAWVEGDVRAGGRRIASGLVTLSTPGGRLVDSTPIIDSTYAAGPLEAGRYVVQAQPHLPYEERPPVFLPTPVEVPEGGRVTLDLETSRGGTPVEVRASEAVAEVILLHGARPLSCEDGSMDDVLALGLRGRADREGRFHFGALPAGHYTLFAVRDWHTPRVEVHREEVEVAAREMESFTLRPRWQPCLPTRGVSE